MREVRHHKSNLSAEILLTDTAKNHILAYLAKQSNSKGVRLSVKKTGCSGFSYVVDYVTTLVEGDLQFDLQAPFALYIDKVSYPFIKGMVIDYVKQGLNQKFVFQNPNQTGQCGCGESFTVS